MTGLWRQHTHLLLPGERQTSLGTHRHSPQPPTSHSPAYTPGEVSDLWLRDRRCPAGKAHMRPLPLCGLALETAGALPLHKAGGQPMELKVHRARVPGPS